ncbi:uncharacterized protein [Dendropsophus ebraccatus]|uniref:uncharacterized protein n=1 Tax=Dendropsophus ebraccatus TaxID=150705 RepID=UPI0038311FB0
MIVQGCSTIYFWICVEERLLITLRFLATGESYASLHFQFRVGLTTISRIVKCTCVVIWQKLQPMVMPSPTEETWRQVAAGFQTVANFPHCLGAVDGKHVRVQQPPHSGSRYYNYKNFLSVVLMAVADANCKFVAIDVGAYGSTGDSRVLQASQIGLQILRAGETLPAAEPLPGSTDSVAFVMISDEAFPLLTNLLRPYPRRELDTRKRIFNFRLSRAVFLNLFRPNVIRDLTSITSFKSKFVWQCKGYIIFLTKSQQICIEFEGFDYKSTVHGKCACQLSAMMAPQFLGPHKEQMKQWESITYVHLCVKITTEILKKHINWKV